MHSSLTDRTQGSAKSSEYSDARLVTVTEIRSIPLRRIATSRQAPRTSADAVRPGLRPRTHRSPDARASRTMPEAAWQPPTMWTGKGGTRKPSVDTTGAANALRRSGSRLTASQMRGHFTVCPRRPAASGHVGRRGRTRMVSMVPIGAASAERLHCGARLTTRECRGKAEP
jgi:hypothetical protein